jgi:hypothetical protein
LTFAFWFGFYSGKVAAEIARQDFPEVVVVNGGDAARHRRRLFQPAAFETSGFCLATGA